MCHSDVFPPRIMPYDVYTLSGKFKDERCNCDVNDAAQVNEYE